MQKPTLLLRDQQMKSFIRDGYIKLEPDYPPELHEKIYRQVKQMFDKNGNLGNNILPLIPDIQQVFDHPLVHGALTGILGPNYVMHSHRFCHFNVPGSSGQDFHKDSYEGDVSANNHRCRWAMAFYYPQNTPKNMGPTAILSGSQYYDTSKAAHQQTELVLSGQAGTITLVHYDLWHRAMPNPSVNNRYMLKFLFYRLQEPTTSDWHNQEADWSPLSDEQTSNYNNQMMYRKLWSWYRGVSTPLPTIDVQTDMTQLLDQLSAELESTRLESAYALGAIGERAVPKLIDRLADKSIGSYATFALGASNQTAVPELISALKHSDDVVRARAAYALGDLRAPSASAQLLLALTDPAPKVRRNATESLGNIGLSNQDYSLADEQAAALSQLLRDEHYWVRDNAVRSLAKMGSHAESATPLLQLALNDENRYVRFNAALALKQIGTPEAQQILFDHLFMSRWCSLTTSDSSF